MVCCDGYGRFNSKLTKTMVHHRSARPTIIATVAVWLILLAVLVLSPSVFAQPTPAAPSRVFLPLVTGASGPQTPEEQARAAQVLDLLNAERARAGCPPVSIDAKLTLAAQRHSQDMAVNDFISHRGSTGSTPDQRASAAGYAWSSVAENVAAGYATPEAVMAGWMQSSAHRQSILNCSFVHVGIGYTFQPDDAPLAGASYPYFHYWTQLFATPR